MIYQVIINELDINNKLQIKYFKRLISICLLISLPFVLLGQNKANLESKRKLLIKEIQSTTKLLSNTKANKEATVNELLTLRTQIKNRKLLIQTIQFEMDYVQGSVQRTQNVIEALTEDIENLRADYKQIIRQSYRMKRSKSKLQFLFSSVSINDLYKRYRTILQYEAYRKNQTQLIINTKSILSKKVITLEEKQLELVQLIEDQKNQENTLIAELSKQASWLEQLKKEEKKLKVELADQNVEHERLNSAIENMIKSEVAFQRSNSLALNKSEFTAKGGTANNTINFKDVSLTFQRENGNLNWPVQEGIIVRSFGEHDHPTLPDIRINNNGVDISTSPNEKVRVVHDGEVVGKQFLPGQHYLVLVKHGNYFTIYSQMKTVSVNRGDKLKAGTVIGVVHTDEDTNASVVHFELWKKKTKLNPERWLAKK